MWRVLTTDRNRLLQSQGTALMSKSWLSVADVRFLLRASHGDGNPNPEDTCERCTCFWRR
jgi:hypothetical protein